LRPRSPYAVSKIAGEGYAAVFATLYGLETVSLRYFNVFGPRQRPDSPYAAVIPRFLAAIGSGSDPKVHGDGLQSRDFTYIDDVVRANRLAAAADAMTVSGRVYNIAAGDNHSIIDLLGHLGRILNVGIHPVHVEARVGDVRSSQADIAAARRDLGFSPSVNFEDGLRKTIDWFQYENPTYGL
jgi:UDP-glucose 4-epimerase